MDQISSWASALGWLIFFLFFGVLLYVYFAVTLMILARKTKTPGAGLAWIPILNLYLMCQIGRRSAFSAAYSGLEPKTIVFKALAALAIWFAVSCAIVYVIAESQIEPIEFRGLNSSLFEKYSPYLLFADF